jgi:hypothetical protein
MLQKGDIVKINIPGDTHHGSKGEIVQTIVRKRIDNEHRIIEGEEYTVYGVQLPKWYFILEEQFLVLVTPTENE